MYFYSLKMGCQKLDILKNYEPVLTVVGKNPTPEKNRVEQKSNIQFWYVNYYPFGSPMPGRNSNPEGHLFGYQGKEKVGNNSKWVAFQLRMYNPSLGRWNGTDPYYQHHSPYLAMANNPVSFVDPDGGKAVMTEYMKRKVLNNLFDNKYKMTRIEWLRVWLGATGMEHYQGITLEGFYSAIATGTAQGINAVASLFGHSGSTTSSGNRLIAGDIGAAVDAYLGPLGGGFLDAPFVMEIPRGDETSLAQAYEAKGAADLANLLSTNIRAEIDLEINFLKNTKANQQERRERRFLKNEKIEEENQDRENAIAGLGAQSGGDLIAQNGGGDGKENEQNPIKVFANKDTGFGPGATHEQIVKIKQNAKIEFDNFGNPDKVEFFQLNRRTPLGKVNNGKPFKGEISYNLQFLIENNKDYFRENDNTFIIRVTGGTINPTAFKYLIYNGITVGNPLIYHPVIPKF